MRILIIGKNSFIGKNFINYSCYNDIKEFDIHNNALEKINLTEVDVVLHLAAIVHQKKEISETAYFAVNADLPVTVAKLAKSAGVKQFIFLSSTKVYGESNNEVFSESSECFPSDNYGKSKLKAEIELQKLEDNNFSVSIIRTPLVYGRGVKANMLSLVKLVDKFPVLPFKRILAKRSMTFVGNLSFLIDRLIDKACSGIFLIQDSETPSIEMLIRIIAKKLGKKVLLFYPGSFVLFMIKHLLPRYYTRLFASATVNNQQTVDTLNLVLPFTLEQGLEEAVTYYKNS